MKFINRERKRFKDKFETDRGKKDFIKYLRKFSVQNMRSLNIGTPLAEYLEDKIHTHKAKKADKEISKNHPHIFNPDEYMYDGENIVWKNLGKYRLSKKVYKNLYKKEFEEVYNSNPWWLSNDYLTVLNNQIKLLKEKDLWMISFETLATAIETFTENRYVDSSIKTKKNINKKLLKKLIFYNKKNKEENLNKVHNMVKDEIAKNKHNKNMTV